MRPALPLFIILILLFGCATQQTAKAEANMTKPEINKTTEIKEEIGITEENKNQQNLILKFEPSLANSDCFSKKIIYQKFNFNMSNNIWFILDAVSDDNNYYIRIGKETESGISKKFSDGGQKINISGVEFEFYNASLVNNESNLFNVTLKETKTNLSIVLEEQEFTYVNDSIVFVYAVVSSHAFSVFEMHYSVFEEVIELNKSNSNLKFSKSNCGYDIVESAEIPRSSQMFEKLIGNKKELTDKEILDYAKASFNQSEMMFKDFILGYHNGIPVRAWFPCSDICPDYTTKIIHYNVSINQCKEIGGSIAIIYVPVGIASSREEFCVPTVLTDNQVYPEKD